MDTLLYITGRWLQPHQLSPLEIVEKKPFPGKGKKKGEKKPLGMKTGKPPQDMVSALECTLSMLEIGKGQEPTQDHNWLKLHHYPTTAYREEHEQPPSKPVPENEPNAD